jgi:integrase
VATIRKRAGRWQVQIRRKGHPSLTRSFSYKSDALVWSHQKELDAERRGLATDHKALSRLSVAEIMVRYRNEIVPRKRGADRETIFIEAFLRQPIAQVAVGNLTTGMVSAYCASRLLTVKPSSVNRELDILRHAFVVAGRDWDIPLSSNAFALVKRPRVRDARTRRLTDGERHRLEEALVQCRNTNFGPLVRLALETAMRRGEILNARWRDLNVENKTLHIPTTKNGYPRTIPLSTEALNILLKLDRGGDDGFIIPTTVDAAKMAWRRIVKRAQLIDLRFHDLRHEAVSVFFEKGLSVPEVALISGHRDPRMLFRYTHPKAELIAMKLNE